MGHICINISPYLYSVFDVFHFLSPENRREKSVGLLTQNFLKLFLTMNVCQLELIFKCLSSVSLLMLLILIPIDSFRWIWSHSMKLQIYCLLTSMAWHKWKVNKPSNSFVVFVICLKSPQFYITSPLLKDDSTEKVKRLYDIANVLASMNLIEKVKPSDGCCWILKFSI